ncbi:MAG: glycosyltransferase [Pseudomonadales bacterium]|nr:glycosyltransferase [Pseudomonadales bacterium]
MRILFVHNNFPGQYRHILTYLADNPELGAEVYAATLDSNQQTAVKKTMRFKPHREPRKDAHPSMIFTERAVIMGQALYSALLPSKKAGFKPDIILSHSGWGAGLFLKDLFPDSKLLTYFEWYYHSLNSDGSFLREEPYGPEDKMRIRLKNTPILQDLAAMDHGQCPTSFQHNNFPGIFKDNISVLHDGVDTEYFAPSSNACVNVGKHSFTARDEVITYVARGMEEYRGFPQFMDVVSKLQTRRPNLHVVILGQDRVAYGRKRSDGQTYKEAILKEYDFDMDRLHFMGFQPLEFFRRLMQISSAHVYLTVPFILSWSMLQAMSAGALIVGSDTEPVREFVTDGENGVLVPFFNTEAIADKLCHILDNRPDYEPLRLNARQMIVDHYASKDLLPNYWDLIKSVVGGTDT